MKTTIRRGVFETNSSSTHSLQLTTGNIDSIYEQIRERIVKRYNHMDDEYHLSFEDYIDTNNVFHINGLDMPDGDEMKNVYAIMYTFLAKVQFIGMGILSNIGCVKEIGNKYISLEYNRDADKIKPRVNDFAVVVAFRKYVKGLLKSKGVVVDDVILDVDDFYTMYYEGFENNTWMTHLKYDNDNDPIFNTDTMNDPDKFIETIKAFLEGDITMTYMDEAYHPYNTPEINVY